MLKSRNPDFENYIKSKIEINHFMHFIGFRITKVEEGYVEGMMDIGNNMKQQDGWLHGGITATVADIVMGIAAYSLVANGERVVTASSSMNYLRPGIGKQLLATGKVYKAGSKFHFCESRVSVREGDAEILIATGSSIMAVV